MKLNLKCRNITISDQMRQLCDKRFEKISKQVPDNVMLELELSQTRNPANSRGQVAYARIELYGAVIRATEETHDIGYSINLVSEELHRQVKRHYEKYKGRRGVNAEAHRRWFEGGGQSRISPAI